MSFNHKILEEVVYRVRKLQLSGSPPVEHRTASGNVDGTNGQHAGSAAPAASQRPGLSTTTESFFGDIAEVHPWQDGITR
jgi:hypothetical protein